MNRITIAVTGALIALVGCGVNTSPWEGTQLDQSGWYACGDFVEQIGKAGGSAVAYELGPVQRASFAAEVAEFGGRSTTLEIKDAAVVLTRTVAGTQMAWKLGMDTFAARCFERGFKAT